MTDFVIKLMTWVAAVLFGGWSLMLAASVVHHAGVKGCPPLGYWASVLLIALGRGVHQGITFDLKGDKP